MYQWLQILTRPLEALCDFQIQHGACKHDSKEYKIENGLWHKTLKKKYLKKLGKDGQTETKLDSSNLKEEDASSWHQQCLGDLQGIQTKLQDSSIFCLEQSVTCVFNVPVFILNC